MLENMKFHMLMKHIKPSKNLWVGLINVPGAQHEFCEDSLMTELTTYKALKEFSLWSYDKNKMLVMGKKYTEINSFSYITSTDKTQNQVQ